MNNIVLQRFNQAPIQPKKMEVPVLKRDKGVPVSVADLETALRAMLHVPAPVAPAEVLKDEIGWPSIFDFCEWYDANSSKFQEHHRKVLDQLLYVRNMVNTGCNCTKQIRISKAHDAYREFWTGNAHTDLAESVRKVANVKRVVFGNILRHPYT